jgi:hypothetical protein
VSQNSRIPNSERGRPSGVRKILEKKIGIQDPVELGEKYLEKKIRSS